MWLSAIFFVLLSLLATSLSEPDIEQSLANFRKALGTKLLAVDAVHVPKPPAVIISTPAHTNLGIIQTYLGTETNNETAEAFQGAQNLVSSGILSPLSESNPHYSGEKKPCHHKEDVIPNKDTVLKPFSDSNDNNTPLSQTAKPCRHKESSTQKPLSVTETPVQPNKDSNSDSTSATKKPCHHSSVQTITSSVALNSNSDKVDIVEHQPVLSQIPAAPQLPPWHVPVSGQVVVEETTYVPDNQFNFIQTVPSYISSLDCNKDKIEVVHRPVLSPIPAPPQLPPWQFSANGQVVVDETSYIPDNQVVVVQPGLNISSSSSFSIDSNNDKIEIVDRPTLSLIPAAPQLPPWQLSANGQIVMEETNYFPDNQVTYVKPGVGISTSFHDCNKNKVEIVERPVISPIPAAPQLPPWQVPVTGQVIVEESEYIPDIHIAIDQHVPSTIPEAPLLPPVWQVSDSGQVVVEENAYVTNNQEQAPCPYKFMIPNIGALDRTNVFYNQEPAVPFNVAPLPHRIPAKVTIPQPVIETIAEPIPVPLVVDVPSTYTYQQVKGDGSVETTYALQDGVHTRYVSNPYNGINKFREYSPRPANNLITTNIKSYHDSVYPTVPSQYSGYPHIESVFNEYNVPNGPYDYNQYPVQNTQWPYNPYPSGYNSGPRPQVGTNYPPGHHVHPHSFNHPQQQVPNNLFQPSHSGYSYKQIHGDGSITSYKGSNDNVQTHKSGSPQLSASKEAVRKPAPQVPFANVRRHHQNFNVSPNQMIGKITPVYNPMIAQEGVKPIYFSYMFKQLGFNGASVDSVSNSKVMSSPAQLPVVNTNVRKPESGLPAAASPLSNVHVTSYSALTNSNDKLPVSSSETGVMTDSMINTVKGTSEVIQSNPGFKVSYGTGEKTDNRKHSIEYNPIIVLDTTTGRSNYYYGQTNSDGLKTEYVGDREKVTVQNVDDRPKVNVRRKYRGDIPE